MTESELEHQRDDTPDAKTFKGVSGTPKNYKLMLHFYHIWILAHLDQGHILGPTDVQQGGTASKHKIN